jgi:transcriptional regulator with XRE-family HTH domain
MTTPYEELLATAEGRSALAEEHAIAYVTELVARLLEESGMSRSEFARKLEVTPGRVTQLLDGDANMTLATIAKMLNVFGYFFEGSARKVDDFSVETKWFPIEECGLRPPKWDDSRDRTLSAGARSYAPSVRVRSLLEDEVTLAR